MTRLPNLFLIGAQKCGTTSTYRFLVDQADVSGPGLKEPNFLSFDDSGTNLRWAISNLLYRHNRIRGEDKYAALFASLPQDVRWIVDGSASYLYGKGTAQKIKALDPAARLIVLLRNPADRAFSEYQMQRAIGAEGRSFEQALQIELSAGHEDLRPLDRRYVWHGRYDLHLRPYLQAFERRAIYVDCVDRPGESLNDVFCRIAGFLTLPNDDLRMGHRENAGYEPSFNAVNRLLYTTGIKALIARLTPGIFKRSMKRFYYRPASFGMTICERQALWRSRLFNVERVEEMTGLDLRHWRMDRDCCLERS